MHRRRPPSFPHDPDLEIDQILSWADAHHQRTGKWPTVGSGLIPELSGERWRNIDQALRQGLRGLESGSSLARLLALHRDRRNVKALPPFSEAQILAWADAYRERTEEWPKLISGSIPESPGDQWTHVNAALRSGQRGLRGGSSLARLLACRRGRPKRPALPLLSELRERPPLAEAQILSWAVAYHLRKGRWPRRGSGPIAGAPGETWGAIDAALSQGQRGLSGGSSLALLCCESAAAPRAASPPPPQPVERVERLSSHLEAMRPKSLSPWKGRPAPGNGVSG